ncbi:MAG: hypothetical protein QOI01_593 [Mycobacterium sp.]|nr:hypothetical protein [Mycobacterium sp.]
MATNGRLGGRTVNHRFSLRRAPDDAAPSIVRQFTTLLSQPRGLRRRVAAVEAPDTFISGEESAVVRRIEGGPALPRDRKLLTTASGVRGRPTLINNVETLAHVALIARYGAEWFRSIGDRTQPGSMLVTLSGALNKRCVVEVPTGALLTDVIGRFGFSDHRNLRAAHIQAHSSAVGVRQIGICSGQVAMARPWRG